MNPNWLSVLSAVLAYGAFLITYQVAVGKSSKTRVSLGVIAALTALPGASFAAYYARFVPEVEWYYQFRSIAGSELLVVFVGVAGGLFATFLPRLLLILPLIGVTAFTIVPLIKPFIGPIPGGALKDKWDGEICLQSTPSTCGAASTATILKHFGIDASEAELAAEAHSYDGGTEAWYMARAARSRGLHVDFDFHRDFAPEGGLPAVVGVRLGSIGHFIAIIGMEGEKFIVGDPLRGRELLTLEELRRRYGFTGFHMRITSKAE